MQRKLRKFFKRRANRLRLWLAWSPGAAATHSLIAYLEKKRGWSRTAVMGRPFDAAGNPVPWYTYPCIDFLSSRISGEMSVFEYGSGNSTLWWASRVKAVTSCEHDKAFAEEISKQAPDNVRYLFRNIEDGSYERAPIEIGEKFKIIIIDGAVRDRCAAVAREALTEDGIIIYDNSGGKKYRAGCEILVQQGFRRIDFRGLGPIWSREWTTGIFYRSGNCLGI
jgi:hypothetical protein